MDWKSHMFKYLLAVTLAAISARALADTYLVECTTFFPDCSKIIVENLSEKFTKKYPPSEWKIVVPTARVFRMGNGSLQSYFDVAVAPRAGEVTSSANESAERARKLKKKFASSKRGNDIAAMGNPDLAGEMFDEARFRKAGLILMTVMAREATQNMMAECAKTPECILYEP